jgi:hypothetical protein
MLTKPRYGKDKKARIVDIIGRKSDFPEPLGYFANFGVQYSASLSSIFYPITRNTSLISLSHSPNRDLAFEDISQSDSRSLKKISLMAGVALVDYAR